MKVITVGNHKGGVGKSTLACNIAVEASREKRKVLLIDADTQKSSMDFRGLRAEVDVPQFNAVAVTNPTIHKDIASFNSFDLVIIDAGGRDTGPFRSALLASDLLVIPALPSQLDIWSTQNTVTLLEDARTFKEINACFVANRVIPNSNIAKEAYQALIDIGIPLLNTKIHSRVAFAYSISEGKGVTEYEPHGKAAQEMKEFYKEVKSWL